MSTDRGRVYLGSFFIGLITLGGPFLLVHLYVDQLPGKPAPEEMSTGRIKGLFAEALGGALLVGAIAGGLIGAIVANSIDALWKTDGLRHCVLVGFVCAAFELAT